MTRAKRSISATLGLTLTLLLALVTGMAAPADAATNDPVAQPDSPEAAPALLDATGCNEGVCITVQAEGGSGPQITSIVSNSRYTIDPPQSSQCYINITSPNGNTENHGAFLGPANGFICNFPEAAPKFYQPGTIICAGSTVWPGYPCVTVGA